MWKAYQPNQKEMLANMEGNVRLSSQRPGNFGLEDSAMALKIFVSVDMEGISGVVHRDHTGRNGKDYDLACRLMTLEANAAIEGAFDAGADEVVVSDSHGTFRNLIPDLLDERALLITGTPVPLGMMSGDSTPGISIASWAIEEYMNCTSIVTGRS